MLGPDSRTDHRERARKTLITGSTAEEFPAVRVGVIRSENPVPTRDDRDHRQSL